MWLCLFFSGEFVVFNIVIISDLFWINVIDVTLMHVKSCAIDILLATLSNRKSEGKQGSRCDCILG